MTSGKNILYELPQLGIMSLLGEQAIDCLQGQVTCDLRKMDSNHIQQGAFCNLKGRVLALFDVFQWRGLQLLMRKDLLQATKDNLNKVALLSRVKMEIRDDFAIFGLYLENKQDLLQDIAFPEEKSGFSSNENGCCYSLGNHLYVLVLTQERAKNYSELFKNTRLGESKEWECLLLHHKIIQIYPETRGLFLPHRLDLHLSGHISFEKGCYKGQEIIARIHYRAKQKHSLAFFMIESNLPLILGDRILDPIKRNELGELVDFCRVADNKYLVALSISHTHPKEVVLASQEISPVVLSSAF